MAIKIGNGGVDESAVDEFEQQAQEFDKAANEIAEVTQAARVVAYEESEKVLADAAKIDNIVERAKAIANEVQFADIKKVRMGDMFIAVPENTDTNKVAVLDYLFKDADSTPHFDLFRGRIVDHRGAILDDFYDGIDFLNAYNAIGLRKLKVKEILEAVRIYALRRRWNDLTRRLESMIPEWDGVVRLPYALREIFECHDSELNRDFSMYFFLSLYARLMHPGEEAPIVLTLIGAQHSGKSAFGKILARMITGDKEADSVQLDLDGSKVDFLREMTGQSVVASVGEMSGFSRSDMDRVKNFITRTHDKFHYKFEGVVHQPRQWITIMDSNRYEGLLRDETGNRRFFPMFVGQLPDVGGQPQWKSEFLANLEYVEENLFKLLAEARAWFEAFGVGAYRGMVRDVSKQVFDFSLNEMREGRGTLEDSLIDPYIGDAMIEVEKHFTKGLDKKTDVAFVKDVDLRATMSSVAARNGVSDIVSRRGFDNGLKKKLSNWGFKKTKVATVKNGIKGTAVAWRIEGYRNAVDLCGALAGQEGSAFELGESAGF